MEKTKTENTFFADLAGLQSIIKNPVKTEDGYDGRYTYAPLDKILDLYKPICLDFKFILLATILNGNQVVEIRHISGESIKGELQIPDFGTDAQKLGSFLTYARRYLIMNILNVMGEEDDDGLKTVEHSQKSSPEGVRLNGTIYTNRSGTSKTGKPFNAFFPADKAKPVYWNKAEFDKALAIAGENMGDGDLDSSDLNY